MDRDTGWEEDAMRFHTGALLDWERAGGEAFVLIGRKLDVLKVPIGKWRSGGKSILLHGHPEWFVPMRGGLPDYMAAEKEEPQDYRARRDRDGPQRV